ncbi:hypothetical protein EPN90_00940 [Patescibacteria group bacterium]|nr:MAG: hypothetical protein EPN90_00940 [Patescibacteria group bacterium]
MKVKIFISGNADELAGQINEFLEEENAIPVLVSQSESVAASAHDRPHVTISIFYEKLGPGKRDAKDKRPTGIRG